MIPREIFYMEDGTKLTLLHTLSKAKFQKCFNQLKTPKYKYVEYQVDYFKEKKIIHCSFLLW